MLKLLSFTLLCILSSSAYAVAPSASNAEEQADSKNKLISRLYGRWEGNIDYQYFENALLNKKSNHPFRIDITPSGLEFSSKNETGEWIKSNPSFVNSFKFKTGQNTISGYFLNSGTDEDGVWVESQNMYITLKNDTTIMLYSMRSVNNTGLKDSHPGAIWMQLGTGELKKNE